MKYHDRIYGSFEIDEPVLADLMRTDALGRLNGILQHGISGLIGITRPTTRFEHSVGVMLLVRRLNGPVTEQIAALLHDVSHTAFSHVIDYVFGGHNSQNYHEEVKEAYVARTDLPETLARHGYDWRDVLHEERYPLLEQPAPALCADRLDYFLRDSQDLGLAGPVEIKAVLDHLRVHDGRIVLDDLETARWLAHTFIAADKASWANFREVGLYEVTARAIKVALATGAISEEDFWGSDQALWQKLHRAEDPELRLWLELASPATRFVWDEHAPTFHVSTKLRTIDPDVWLGDQVRPLSFYDPGFAHDRARYLAGSGGLWPVRVVTPDPTCPLK